MRIAIAMWADANAGDTEAQNSLGITYQRGLSGVANDRVAGAP